MNRRLIPSNNPMARVYVALPSGDAQHDDRTVVLERLAPAVGDDLSRIQRKDGEVVLLHYVAGEFEVDGELLCISIGQPDFVLRP